jgi:hypothetical protein
MTQTEATLESSSPFVLLYFGQLIFFLLRIQYSLKPSELYEDYFKEILSAAQCGSWEEINPP